MTTHWLIFIHHMWGIRTKHRTSFDRTLARIEGIITFMLFVSGFFLLSAAAAALYPPLFCALIFLLTPHPTGCSQKWFSHICTFPFTISSHSCSFCCCCSLVVITFFSFTYVLYIIHIVSMCMYVDTLDMYAMRAPFAFFSYRFSFFPSVLVSYSLFSLIR